MSLRLMAHLVEQGCAAVVPITADQYMKMAAAGILPEGSPIELLDGMLIYKDRRDGPSAPMTQGPRHLLAIKLLAKLLEDLLPGDAYHVQQQGPIICNRSSVPEPDLCIVKGPPHAYSSTLPSVANVALAIEVSQSSLSLDLTDKADLYGASGVPLYWVVNLADDSLTVMTQPRTTTVGYARQNTFQRGMAVELTLAGGETWSLAVDDLLPPPLEP